MAKNNKRSSENAKKKIRVCEKIISKINKQIFRGKIKYLKYLLKKTIKAETQWDDVFIKVTADKIIIAFVRIQEYAKDNNDYFTHKIKKVPIKKINVEIKSLQNIIKNKKNGENKFKNFTKRISKGIKNVSRLFKLFIA